MGALERIAPALAGLATATSAPRDGIACLEIAPGDLRAVAQRLRDACGFETSTFVTAVDRFPAEPRFEVVWQFLSLAHRERVRLRARGGGSAPRVPSLADLFPGASFSERECFDLFGIVFEGHPDLRRLLMPEGYTHHPLRKDFPHQGIEPDRLYREWDERRRQKPAEAAP